MPGAMKRFFTIVLLLGSTMSAIVGCGKDDPVGPKTSDVVWVGTNDACFGQVVSLAINSRGHVFAGTSYSGGAYRSEDDGNTWTPINSGLPDTAWSVRLAVASSGYIFAVTGGGVYRSADNGDSWLPANPGLPAADCRLTCLATSPSGDVVCGGFCPSLDRSEVYRSRDNGDSWVSVGHLTNYTHDIVVALAIGSSGRIVAGTDRRLHILDEQWTCVDLAENGNGALAINSRGQLFAGSDFVYVWDDGGMRVGGGGVYRFKDNYWGSWEYIGPRGDGVYALAIDSRGRIFAGGTRLFVSQDNGESWMRAYWGIEVSRVDVRALAVSPSGYVFAGAGGCVYRSGSPTD